MASETKPTLTLDQLARAVIKARKDHMAKQEALWEAQREEKRMEREMVDAMLRTETNGESLAYVAAGHAIIIRDAEMANLDIFPLAVMKKAKR